MDRWQQVQDIFEQALQRPPEQRGGLLAEACRDDPDLRAEVESLLKHHDESGDEFMRPPLPPPTLPPCPPQTPATPTADAPDLLIGQQIGAYRIERVLGVGGIGTVYLAEQQQPQRLVALKLLRAGIASSSALLRFEYEAEILARLRHPNIAEVYQAGTAEVTVAQRPSAVSSARPAEGGWTTSVPYFAMEYIPEARPITEYADQEGLDARRRLRLFEQVCEAVQHGHQRGVIHRDLKPANILVDAAGRVKVIDFGVARATDADIALTTLRTETGQLIGTLQYMSPEQCHADPHEIDTRSDVYSLGVVLYELLCGRLPYDVTRTPIPTAARVICEQTPPRPSGVTGKKSQCGTGFQPVSDKQCGTAASAVVPPVKGDLERIVLTALEKDRQQRYQSAADLLRDIRHYLNREPIEARPPTVWTRAARWMGRHPVAATTAACMLIFAIGIASTLASAWYLRSQPSRMDPTVDIRRAAREVRLLSVGGSELNRWKAEPGSMIILAEVIDRPGELGGGKLVALAYAPHPNTLQVFDTGQNFDRAIWEGGPAPGEPLPDPHHRGYTSDQFHVRMGAVFDIFDEIPGQEIVAVHSVRKRSQCIIRIYDLRGEILYQVWHDGTLEACYWLSDSRVLVFAGLNSEVPLKNRGYPDVKDAHAVVVFGLRPQLHTVHYEFIHTANGWGSVDPAWYRYLYPIELRDNVTARSLSLPVRGDPAQSVNFSFELTTVPGAGIGWDVDEFGDRLPGPPLLGDYYQSNRDRLPDPNAFHLGPLPPVESSPIPKSTNREP